MSRTASLKVEPRLTPEEYLARERLATEKSEYLDGRVFAMAGASIEHNTIAFNVGGELRAQLKGTDCRGYGSDMRVRVTAAGLYTYPDLFVVCGEHRFDDERRDTLLNPTLIIEVLSPSTEVYDRGDKFDLYRQLPSLREYVLIAQDPCRVEQLLRQDDDRWDHSETTSLDAVVRLSSIGCDLRLVDVYDGVTFSASEGTG